jgi:hypothetical protein
MCSLYVTGCAQASFTAYISAGISNSVEALRIKPSDYTADDWSDKNRKQTKQFDMQTTAPID